MPASSHAPRSPSRASVGAVKPAQLRAFCLGLPDAVEEFPFNATTSVFKVGGKVFAITGLGDRPLRVSVKCDPELGEQLRAGYEGIEPGYHLNKRHWITIRVNSDVPARLIRDLVEDSHDLVRPRRR
jgi:predicted DNA-binding protein (MmcQ/YjbR family)